MGLGEALMKIAVKVSSEAERTAADMRDRVAVVLARRYRYVERAAGWRWGRALDAHVPAMFSREVVGAKARGEAVDDHADDGGETG